MPGQTAGATDAKQSGVIASDRRARNERDAEDVGALTSAETSASRRHYGSRACNCFLEVGLYAFSPVRGRREANHELSLDQPAGGTLEMIRVCASARVFVAARTFFSAFSRASFLTRHVAAPMPVCAAARRRR